MNNEVMQKSDSEDSGSSKTPAERLIQVVKSMPFDVLNDAARDIAAVTTLSDRVSVQNESGRVTFQDLTEYRNKFEGRAFTSLAKGPAWEMKMKHQFNVVPPDSAKYRTDCRDLLMDEIKEIEKRFIDIVVTLKDSHFVSEVGSYEGTLIALSCTPVERNKEMLNSPSHTLPSMILELVVPADYPKSLPRIPETPHVVASGTQAEDLYTTAKSKFSLTLTQLPEPVTLTQMARTWRDCAHDAFCDYAQQTGGGNFSCRYGRWKGGAEEC